MLAILPRTGNRLLEADPVEGVVPEWRHPVTGRASGRHRERKSRDLRDTRKLLYLMILGYSSRDCFFQRRRAYNRDMGGGVERLPVELGLALERGAVVVTGNQRAARTLRRAYDRECREQGLVTWRPPAIVAWETWSSALWRQLVLEGYATSMLLNSSQEHAIWRMILSADGELESLRNVDSLARMAAEAWELLCQHRGQDRLRNAAGSTDTRAFQRWAQEFVRGCRVDDLLAGAQLEEALRGVLGNGAAALLPVEIVLAGFDR